MTARNETMVNPEACLSLPLLEDPTAARMNRKHKLRSSKQPTEVTEKQKKRKTSAEAADTSQPASLAAIPGVKLGARYEPEVPMSKAEVTQWRKLARRVRNRESAAASREKTRQRIEELEAALAESRSKHQAALERIAELEKAGNIHSQPNADDSFPSIIYTAPAVSPPMSPRDSLSFSLDDDIPDLIRPMYQQSMISRPTAEKKIYTNTAADTHNANETSVISSEALSEGSVVDSDEVWDDSELDDPEIGDFLYDALYNEHPVETEVDFDALATV